MAFVVVALASDIAAFVGAEIAYEAEEIAFVVAANVFVAEAWAEAMPAANFAEKLHVVQFVALDID